MKSSWMVLLLLLMSCSALISYSSSDAPGDNKLDAGVNAQSAGNGQASIEDSNIEQFYGTWKSDCIALSTTVAKLVTFIYDGQRAAFITEFHGPTCSSTPNLELLTGNITFQDMITDTAFGASAHPFVFSSDDTAASDFRDLLYIEDSLLYFGDPGTKPSENEGPTGLNLAQPFRLQGESDFSVVEDNQRFSTVNIEIEGLDNAIADSPERAISPDALTLGVMVNGQPIPMMLDSNFWTGNVRVVRDSSILIEVLWDEKVAGTSLRLAQASHDHEVSDQDINVKFVSDSYDTSFDQDGDGFSNLDERINGTDPFDAASPGTP